MTGKVGIDLSIDQGYKAAKETLLNCLSTAKKEPGTLDRIKRVVKLFGMVNCSPETRKFLLKRIFVPLAFLI